jgi:hypothetical protein
MNNLLLVFFNELSVVGGLFVSGGGSGKRKRGVTGHGVGVVFNGKFREVRK